MSTIIDNYYYTKEHEWISVDGNIATIGITDFAQSSLGDIVFVELPDSDEEITAESSFGVVESIKSVSDLYAPVTGKVIEKNSDVEDSPESLNDNAFDAWLVKIEMSDTSELDALMSSNDYKEYCNSKA
jgi:glycine cleavage system H protein